MKVLLAHPGTQYSGRLAAELGRLGALGSFHTGFAIAEGGTLDRILSTIPYSWRRRLANRRLSNVAPDSVRLHPIDEGLALIRHRLGRSEQATLHERNRRFQLGIPDSAFAGVDAVIGFDTSSWILARRCRKLGIPLVLDQSIGHPDSKSRTYDRLRQQYPAWSHDAEERLTEVREAEAEEHESCARVVCASTFSKATLVENGVAADKIRVNPYGVDASLFLPHPRHPPGPMRFCYVGSITVRKGVAQLLATWSRLAPDGAELWLIGPAPASVMALISGHRNVVYKGAVPNAELPLLLAQCDVFVFPSFFEGFALVILEAMACGLPVITTDATAGPDIIHDGEDGWILSVGDDDALASAIAFCISNPDRVADAGLAARRTAERFTWKSYGDRWLGILDEIPA